MNLITIGKKLINLDNVTSIDTLNNFDNSSRVCIYSGEDMTAFYGVEAAALRVYFASMSVDIIAMYEHEEELTAYNAAATARTCPTCGGEGDCPDCNPLPY